MSPEIRASNDTESGIVIDDSMLKSHEQRVRRLARKVGYRFEKSRARYTDLRYMIFAAHSNIVVNGAADRRGLGSLENFLLKKMT